MNRISVFTKRVLNMRLRKNKTSRWLKTIMPAAFLVLLVCSVAFGQSVFIRENSEKSLSADQAQKASQAVINSLTGEERDWLRAHPVIRVVQDPGWPPVEFIDEQGKFAGMAGDYLKIVEQKLGLKFERVRGLSWQEAYERLRRREIDMTTSVAVTPERSEFWAFTRPYMKIPIVIVAHMNVTYISDMRELAGKKVAVVDGYAVNDWIPNDFPGIELVRVKTAQEGLEILQRREVFAYIENMLVVGYYMARLKLTTLKIAGETPYINAQCMAVRKDWAPLAAILQKALDSISETQRNEIYRKWLPIRYEHGSDYTVLWYALAMFIIILSGMAAWNWKLSQAIRSRKIAETALKKSEERVQIILDNLLEGAQLIGRDWRYLYVNDAVVRQSGKTKEELLGKTMMDVYPGIEKTDVFTRIRECIENHITHRMDNKFIYPDKTSGWFRLSIQPVQEGVFILSEDVTEQKKAEETFRESDERFKALFDHSLDGVFIHDLEGNFLDLNQAALEKLGYDREEILSLNFAALLDEEQVPKAMQVMEELRQTGVQQKPAEFRLKGKQGNYIDVETLSSLINRGGKPFAIVGISRDMTERKQAEEEIIRLNLELGGKVAERTGELRNSQLALLNLVDDLNESAKKVVLVNNALEAANKELEAFSYSVSHDLRAPLRGIDGFSLALLEDYGDKLDAAATNYLERIRKGTQQMGWLIDDLLKLSRINRAELIYKSIDLSKMIQSITEEHKQRNPDRTVAVTIKKNVVVQGDFFLMKIALTNLLDNAWKFTGKEKYPQIEFGSTMQEGKTVIFLRDNGVGFDMSYVDKLFGAFQRLHAMSEFPGTGIGLATVQRVIRRHGGTVWAEGEVGKGATFYFTLPE